MNNTLFKLSSFIICTFFCHISYAQLKVISSGQVGVGTYAPVSKFEVWDNGLSELRLWTNPVGGNNGISRFWAINYSNAYGLGIDASGQGHIYNNLNNPTFFVTFGGNSTYFGNSSIPGYVLPYTNNTGQVGTAAKIWNRMYSTYIHYTYTGTISDIKYKENVKTLRGLEIIRKLRGVSYDLNNEGRKRFLIGDSSDVWKNNYGFIAQEIKEILPNLIVPAEKGDSTLYINYNGFIPLLVESVKELDQVIKKQELELNSLKEQIENQSEKIQAFEMCCEKLTEIKENNKQEASLFQNQPNPFNKETKIRYLLPSKFSQAYIYIYNLQGTIIKTLRLSNVAGEGNILIDANDLFPGVYYYSLFIDNQEINTKKMVITQ